MNNVIENLLRDTDEFPEETIERSADFVSEFARKMMNIKWPDISYLFKRSEEGK